MSDVDVHYDQYLKDQLQRLFLAMTRAKAAGDAVATANLQLGLASTIAALSAYWEAIAVAGGH